MRHVTTLLIVLLFIGCKGQKEEILVEQISSDLPVKIDIIGTKDSTLVNILVPQEFVLKSNYDKDIVLDNFQYRNRFLLNESTPNFLKGYDSVKKTLMPTPYKIKLFKNEKKKFLIYVGYYLFLNKEEFERINQKIITKNKAENIFDLGKIEKYSKLINNKIKSRGYIYVTIFNSETLLTPDIEIPIKF